MAAVGTAIADAAVSLWIGRSTVTREAQEAEMLDNSKSLALGTFLVVIAMAAQWSYVIAEEAEERPAGGSVPAGWMAAVKHDLSQREYEVTWQAAPIAHDVEPGWQAPNRAHGFRSYFTVDGIRLIPRLDEIQPSWTWGLSLRGYGRGGTVWPASRATPSPSGARVEYRRGAVLEWYENSERGLKQGFTLPAPPEEVADLRGLSAVPADQATTGGQGIPGRGRPVDPAHLVHVDLSLTGSLSPRFAADGQAIDFVTSHGTTALRYAQLLVTDARGEIVPSWMEGFVAEGIRGIRLVMDERNAVYPLAIDPLVLSGWDAQGDQASAFFGQSAGTAGDVNGDGYSDVIVGAPGYDSGETDEGRAFVYLGSPSGLSLAPAWTAEGDQASASFGHAVGTAGDVNGDGYADVIVGASAYDNGEMDEGRAFVYLGSASGLATTAGWTAEGDQASASFGGSVGTAGDVNGDGYADLIVGAELYDNGAMDEGAAFVYLGSASGPAMAAGWTAEGDQASASFGGSVGTAGDVNGDGYADLIVGAYLYDDGAMDEGAAFVYLGSASGPAMAAAWTAGSDQASAAFGRAVGTAGDVNGDGYADVIVGADLHDLVFVDAGAMFLYLGSASGLAITEDYFAPGDQLSAGLGGSVGTAGDVNGDGYADIIIGAKDYDAPEIDEGVALVLHGSASGPATAAAWTAEGNQASANFGYSVGTAGDVNGDGYADSIIGAYLYDNGESDEGRAFVYLGSASGPATAAAWTAEGNQALANFGASVGTAGDVNGDGYADVIVGANLYDNGETNEGRAFVYLGSASGLSATAAWTAESNQASAQFGWSVGTAGDVNSDGFADVIVGAIFYDSGQTNEGQAFVYYGSSTGLATTAAWTAEGNQTSADFGNSVGTAGDVNGDGYADVIIGAHQYDNGEANEGGAFVYLGSSLGLATTAAWTAESNQAGALLGSSVGTAGDVNGDGYSDVIVGVPNFSNGQSVEGMAFVYLGSGSGLSGLAWFAESNQAGALLGSSVGTAGDVNGDGFADVLVGAPSYTNGESAEGRAFVYLGSPSGLSLAPDWTAEGDQASASFGRAVGTAGDMNGDGYSDVIVGARAFDNGQTNEGQAFVYHGNNGGGLSLRPQQRRADDSAPIAPGGRSRDLGAFRLAALGRTPFGRARVRLEWEVKPLGSLFDGTGTQQSAWIDSGSAGADLNELVSGLDPGAYHWRVRLRYDPVTTPFQSAGRWFTVPWNGWQERDLTLSAFLGGALWNDVDGDGIRAPAEPALGGVLVYLLDATSFSPLSLRVSMSDGSYRFELPGPGPFRLDFIPPEGWVPTVPDQGTDDLLDSDADPITGVTAPVGPIYTQIDEVRWSAGLQEVGLCIAPDEPLFIPGIRMVSGTNYVILDFQDPNQPQQVTGYNAYRSTDPALPPASWMLLGSDVVDADDATPNLQWVDRSGDTPPLGGAFYYQMTAYNHICGAEGPR